MSASLRRLLIVEDGHEYEEFVRLFLGQRFDVRVAHDAAEALRVATDFEPEVLLLDLRFERTPADALEGDADELAARRFGGDRARALRHLQDQQGTIVLAQLRAEGITARALFVHDFPARRLSNLQQLYGDVCAIPTFDAQAMAAVLGA